MALGNAKPTFTCDSCGRRRSGASTTSVTGRRLCAECDDQLTGAAAGVMASQGRVGEAIATAGWFTALRAHRRSRPSPGDSA
ncbi:hypothetical protein [Pseudofrankia asymbiotica]|uniref:Uncharacterized protein n=1 Tax=Pseudofrankia asymbiotica TaxID=1834516 RepID=A0A1V2IC05_9ACTN|nr:hypothetical protein [Pseudofrankia asymbiotica]ONH29538.1 hypothetical protein BL253_16960 [Pseudofrankia asymbiotica]